MCFHLKKKKKSPTSSSPPKNLITFAIFGLEMIFETKMGLFSRKNRYIEIFYLFMIFKIFFPVYNYCSKKIKSNFLNIGQKLNLQYFLA